MTNGPFSQQSVAMLAFIALLSGMLLAPGYAQALEQPDYRVEQQFDSFELRRYSAYLVAEVEVTGEFDKVGDQAFRILFDYISGANAGNQEIQMTAPVEQALANRPNSDGTMTGTSSSGIGQQTYRFSFVMPAEFNPDSLPEPEHPAIRIRRVDTQLVAALTYSGTWSESRYREHENQLLNALANEGLTAAGPTVFARYNAPFVPWFVRKNEVLQPVSVPLR